MNRFLSFLGLTQTLLALCAFGQTPRSAASRLQDLKAGYAAANNEARTPEQEFEARYETELGKLETTAQEASNLELVSAIREEKATFRSRQGNAVSAHAELAKLQRVFTEHSAALIKKRQETQLAVLDQYLSELGKLRDSATTAGQGGVAAATSAEITLASSELPALRQASGRPDAEPKGATETPPEAPKGITVIEALYGSAEQFETGTAKNVTAIVQRQIVDGKLFIADERETLGDPHPYHTKIFRMKYLRDGKMRRTGKPYEYEASGTQIEVRR